jgi:serine/threonine protein kinase
MTSPVPDTLCPGCFADQGHANPCPHCGYDNCAARGHLLLPHFTVLNGQFIVGRVLGKPGGFGITYLGWDLNLQTRVAIKEYLPRDLAGRSADRTTVAVHSQDEGDQFRYGLEQFLREARTLAQIDHPNIVRVRQFFEAHGTAYLVMDYYRGLSLAEYLDRQGGRLPEEQAKALMLPILDGLRAVHAKGFMHRDIKPQNIYLAQSDGGGARPILLDFGAARHARGERSRSLSVVISPGYAPFEQYHRKGQQGPWTDIYGAAAVLYQMVTGELPLEATERQSGDELRPATAFGVSRGLSDALDAGLALIPAARPQTVQSFQALLHVGARSSVAQLEPVETTSATSPTATVPRHRWWPMVLAGGVLLLVLAGSYLYHGVHNDSADREAMAAREAERAAAEETARKAQAAREAQAVRAAAAAMHRAADDRAYSVARGVDTERAYRTYLEGCAADGCGHRAEAEQAIARILRATLNQGMSTEHQSEAEQHPVQKNKVYPSIPDVSVWQADWGSEIRATARTSPCQLPDLAGQGYPYMIEVDIPRRRLARTSDAWSISGDHAQTVRGCWFEQSNGLAHARMIRKKDGKVTEQDLNFNDGSWSYSTR